MASVVTHPNLRPDHMPRIPREASGLVDLFALASAIRRRPHVFTRRRVEALEHAAAIYAEAPGEPVYWGDLADRLGVGTHQAAREFVAPLALAGIVRMGSFTHSDPAHAEAEDDPEEIAARAAAVRAGWTPEEERRRRRWSCPPARLARLRDPA